MPINLTVKITNAKTINDAHIILYNDKIPPNYLMRLLNVEDNKRQKYEILRLLINQMLYYVDNGIIQNGGQRLFDIIDYYDLIPIRIDIFFNIVCEYLTADETRKLKKRFNGR